MLRTPFLIPAVALGSLLLAPLALAGGTLTPVGSTDQPIQILDHGVRVVVQDGFARTEVTQTFYNPNATDLEAIYRVPVPEHACLSEMEMFLGERTLTGEVVERERARELYEQERDAGHEAGLAEEQATRVYDFRVTPVPAGGEASFRYLYYEPVEIETGIGRLLYPLEDGGTDEAARSFWSSESVVQRQFTYDARIESAWPIEAVRLPGLEGLAVPTQVAEGIWDVSFTAPGGLSLERDLVLYWRLADDLPGRMELISYRDDPAEPGTFQLVLTPGVDLAPLEHGIDTTFVLDTSGSMSGKLGTLAAGVAQAIEQLRPDDRFRVIVFSSSARDLLGGFLGATRPNVDRALEALRSLSAGRSTNLYAALELAQAGLDADRANVIALVTDGVANEGFVHPAQFEALVKQVDVRLFGYLLGNSANWPLMRTITEATGGSYSQISNADDVLGVLMQARSEITHAALTDVEVEIDGVHVFDAGLGMQGKLFRGEQLVFFGRYTQPGAATIRMRAKTSEVVREYTADVVFPARDTDHPELERMWAKDRIDRLRRDLDLGRLPSEEAESAITDLAVAYQLVTTETSMVVLDDAVFEQQGIARENRDRVDAERTARTARQGQVPVSRRVDSSKPAFPGAAPRFTGGRGGGSFGWVALVLVALVGLTTTQRFRRSDGRLDELEDTPWNGFRRDG